MMWQPVWATRCPRLENLGSHKNLSDFDVGVFSRGPKTSERGASFDVAFVAVLSAAYSDEAVQVLTKLRALHAERE